MSVEENTGKKAATWPLLLASIGVVFGDIGTSPLYALKSCFVVGYLSVIPLNVLGLCSLFAWTLFLVVSVKYVYVVLKVNNQGEGGLFALSLLCSRLNVKGLKKIPLLLGTIGIALFFSDGVLTPAISVLGALEGLHTVTNKFDGHIVALSCVVLTLLFFFQKRGTSAIGSLFGPVMILWFSVLGLLGIGSILQTPSILKALNPYYALLFFTHNHWSGFLTMGAVILVVTGAEALYADLGHFGRKPIQYAWSFFVLPALLMNYLGQGALLLRTPGAISNPFYLLAPHFFILPLIILATVATVIASQAVISGMFSVSWQAIMLNYLPRMKVIYTSRVQIGQVYVPIVNMIMYVLTVFTVVFFRTTDALSVAYGLSIASCMLLTTLLIIFMARYEWQWKPLHLILFFAPLLFIDLIFFSTNVVKIIEGAWFTLLISMAVFYLIRVWRTGQHAKGVQQQFKEVRLLDFLKECRQHYPQALPGTAVYLTRWVDRVPKALEIQVQHNKLLHEKNIFIGIETHKRPWISFHKKYLAQQLEPNTYHIEAHYGFKEIPDLNKVIHWAEKEGILSASETLSFFITRASPRASIDRSSHTNVLTGFSEILYIFLANNALPATEFFKLPIQSVVEVILRYEV
ncbi:MAG: potassium transporter [Gammaproteobacteria bacterium]|jgi:KUP system potassium uptake protein|nr:potassium transporter [Gammaproteobacteria bacterium]